MTDRLLTFDDVAEELCCSVSTVKRRVRSGELPTFVDGRLVRVREADLRRYVTEHVSRRGAGDAAAAPAGSTVCGRLWD